MVKNSINPNNLSGTLNLIKKEIEKNFKCKVNASNVELHICNGYIDYHFENDNIRVNYEIITSNGAFFYHQTEFYYLND
jgi:hypothetical protein